MIFQISFLNYLTIYPPTGIIAYIDYLFFKSFHYQIMHMLMQYTPLIVLLWHNCGSLYASSWTQEKWVELQDLVPIFAKFSGGGPEPPPLLNTTPSGSVLLLSLHCSYNIQNALYLALLYILPYTMPTRCFFFCFSLSWKNLCHSTFRDRATPLTYMYKCSQANNKRTFKSVTVLYCAGVYLW